MRGKYIVIEGAEGVGKTTQVRKLAEALRSIEIPVKVFREPDGESDRTTQVLRKITQDPSYPMNSRTEVLLYNAARSQSLEKIRAARDDGFVCLVDRSYLTTLAIQFYGRGDIADYERLNQIIDFAVGDVKPDLTIVLDAPVDVLMARKSQTGEKERFDQLDAAFLGRVRSGYLWEARQRDLPIIYALGTTDEVFRDIWKLLTPVLALRETRAEQSKPISVAEIIESLHKPEEPALETDQKVDEVADEDTSHSDAVAEPVPPTFYTPHNLESDERTHYTQAMTELATAHETMTHQLTQYLLDQDIASMPSIATSLAERYLRPVLPLAMLGEQHDRPSLDEAIRTLAAKLLPRNYVDRTDPIRLTRCTPRNELDCVGEALYEYCDLPMVDIEALLRVLPYETKSQLLTSYLSGQHAERTLKLATYQWDLITDYATYEDFAKLAGGTSGVLQAPSPRLGFETPEIIEQAGLSDAYADCFDQSLTLYSAMQAAGQMQAAEYAVLLGHRLRWKVTTNAYEMRMLRHLPEDVSVGAGCRALIDDMLEKQAETHPIIAEAVA